MKIDVEIYEAIRKLHVQDNLSQRAIAKKLGISGNTVRKYIDGTAVPWVFLLTHSDLALLKDIVQEHRFLIACFAKRRKLKYQ